MAAPHAHRPVDLMQLLTRAERLLGRRLGAILTTEGHTLDAWRVLTLLSDGAGHHMTEIAEHAFLPPGTLTKLVDHLVEDNLVYRRIDEIDRRRIRAHLTPRGRRLHQRVSRQVEASLAVLAAADSDRARLEQLLAGLVDALTERPADAADASPAHRLEPV